MLIAAEGLASSPARLFCSSRLWKEGTPAPYFVNQNILSLSGLRQGTGAAINDEVGMIKDKLLRARLSFIVAAFNRCSVHASAFTLAFPRFA
jgi:hypothetical protein